LYKVVITKYCFHKTIPYVSAPYSITAKDCLTIAGVNRDITLPGKITFFGEKKIKNNAEQQLKMTDYDIDTPTMFFGITKPETLLLSASRPLFYCLINKTAIR
jgi:hypothetical protein